VHHWKRADRPAFGWASLTDTERRIAGLVAQGLSNRQVAGQVFLSTHTVAFHLRHIFWKLDVSSRVQLARLVAEHRSERAGDEAESDRGSVGSPAEHRGADVRQDVIRELQWDPQVSDPDAISVAVKDGAVTLRGHAPTYAEKLAAVRAAERV
jgi:DNA-binding CsgD family transcriptional regulator